MEPDIRFFQAAATVIPTLLIAIVFTVKLFELQAFPVPSAITADDDENEREHASDLDQFYNLQLFTNSTAGLLITTSRSWAGTLAPIA